jgi:hypothetical protein
LCCRSRCCGATRALARLLLLLLLLLLAAAAQRRQQQPARSTSSSRKGEAMQQQAAQQQQPRLQQQHQPCQLQPWTWKQWQRQLLAIARPASAWHWLLHAASTRCVRCRVRSLSQPHGDAARTHGTLLKATRAA